MSCQHERFQKICRAGNDYQRVALSLAGLVGAGMRGRGDRVLTISCGPPTVHRAPLPNHFDVASCVMRERRRFDAWPSSKRAQTSALIASPAPANASIDIQDPHMSRGGRNRFIRATCSGVPNRSS